jgi:hypothetical protein
MFERVRGKAIFRGLGLASLLALAGCGGDLVPRGRVERPS